MSSNSFSLAMDTDSAARLESEQAAGSRSSDLEEEEEEGEDDNNLMAITANMENVGSMGSVAASQLASQASHLAISASSTTAVSSSENTPRMGGDHDDGMAPRPAGGPGTDAAALMLATGPDSDLPNGRRRCSLCGSGLTREPPGNAAPRMSVADGGREGYRGCARRTRGGGLDGLPNEVLLHILGYLDVCDLLATSRTNHHLRQLSLAPILHALRLRRTRTILPPLLCSPQRPSLAELAARHIFMTNTTVVSRRLARSLVSIRLSRRLAARPSAEALVARSVLPAECAPGIGSVSPAIVARRRAVERERVKDGLRRFVGAVWTGEVGRRGEGVRRWEESRGVGRVWRLKRFWERVGRGEFGGGGGGGQHRGERRER